MIKRFIILFFNVSKGKKGRQKKGGSFKGTYKISFSLSVLFSFFHFFCLTNRFICYLKTKQGTYITCSRYLPSFTNDISRTLCILNNRNNKTAFPILIRLPLFTQTTLLLLHIVLYYYYYYDCVTLSIT